MSKASFILATLALSTGLPSRLAANVVHVPADQPTIQAAINQALYGDTVLVAPGTYSGSGNRDIVFQKKVIVLKSEAGAEQTIIDVQGAPGDPHHGFIIIQQQFAPVVIEGFTIKNGYVGSSMPCGCSDDGGAGIYIASADPIIRNCIIRENFAFGRGAGILINGESKAIIENCSFLNNTAKNSGGAVHASHAGSSSVTAVRNCLVEGNLAGAGGGIYCAHGLTRITNCTITNNLASAGGGVYNEHGTVIVSNSMLWGNEEAIYGGDQLFAHAGTAEGLSVSYSNVEGGLDAIGTCCDPPMGQSGVITWGPGNIDADPLFTSNSDPGPDGEWGTRDDEYGDLRLQPGSPCIDAADDSPVCSISDLSGNPRRLDDPASADTGAGRAPTPDMGAYEFVPSDCNANGIPDDREADLDGNGNSIPDQCELVLDDCDQDGIIDGCEQSSDCNDNGAADSCDITSGLSQDCNKNHVPDECDIASGFAQDDNLDGVPDTCSCVTLSDCADLNGDGIRNSACAWWTCESGTCAQTAISYADMGGSFGDCPPDGTVDAHDIFHALNCFADLDTMGNAQSYPCEPDPPNALNADAGGPFGFCCPDGVCDGNDAFHVLNVFAGVTPCTCPYLFCPCTPWAGTCSNDPYQSCTFLSGCDEGAYCNLVWCPPAPAPDPPPNGGARVVGTAQVILEPARPWTRPGATIEVHVLLRNALADLRGYQLHVSVSGGRSGSLELTDMAIEHRKDQVFSGLGAWQALNARTKQLLAGLDGQGIATRENAYLATLTFKATRDAEGTFLVDLLHDDRDASQRTFFFPTPPGTRNLVQVIKPAAIHVGPASSRSQR